MTTEQKLREALQAYQDANEMSPYGDYSKIEWESSAGPVNPSWGGGDCKKHGRWYGRCYSCSDEWGNLRKQADRDAYTARENALNAAKQLARQALATTEPDMPLSMNQFGRLVELTREHLSDNTFVYKATSKTGDTCHFGVESAAKAWAKGGTVEAIKVRDFKLHTSSPTTTTEPAVNQQLTTGPVDELPEPHAVITGKLGAHCSFNSNELRKGDPIYTADRVQAYGKRCWNAGFRHGDLSDENISYLAQIRDAVAEICPGASEGLLMNAIGGPCEVPRYVIDVVQELKEDAERYRWLADSNNYYEAINLISDGSLTEDALGKAIDAAMAKGVKG